MPRYQLPRRCHFFAAPSAKKRRYLGFVKLTAFGDNWPMGSLYKRHRFPPEIISHAVWLYHRFPLSFRDVEDLMAEHGVTVSYEAIRFWCRKFGPEYARTLRRRQGRLGDIWHVDELFITIRGQRPLSLESGGPGWRCPRYLGHTLPR